MGSFKIRRLQIPQNVIETLEKHNLTSCKDVLSLTQPELQAALGMNQNKAENILKEISKKCVSDPKTLYELHGDQICIMSSGFLSLSLHALDLLLQGGLPLGSITELSGPPGVGKTQFCYLISILAIMPQAFGGLESSAVYIDTESTFSAERLGLMARKRFPRLYKSSTAVMNLLKKVLVHKVSSIKTLKNVVSTLEKEIIGNKTKVIIVDSIASLIRKEYGGDDISCSLERNKLLMEQASILKDLAQAYNVVVFLTNQITSHVTELDSVFLDVAEEDDDEEYNEDEITGLPAAAAPAPQKMELQEVNSDHVLPALGNTWSHCVSTRLVAQFLDSSVHQLRIQKSPLAQNAAVNYILNETGVVLTDDDIEFLNASDHQNRSLKTKYNFLTSEITGTGTVFSASPVT